MIEVHTIKISAEGEAHLPGLYLGPDELLVDIRFIDKSKGTGQYGYLWDKGISWRAKRQTLLEEIGDKITEILCGTI